jgi:ribonucleoside-diphosphate reductase alpha chain
MTNAVRDDNGPNGNGTPAFDAVVDRLVSRGFVRERPHKLLSTNIYVLNSADAQAGQAAGSTAGAAYPEVEAQAKPASATMQVHGLAQARQVRRQVAGGAALALEERTTAEVVLQAKVKGYEGDPCHDCGNFTLVRNGTCLKCDTCGATSGCS